MNGLSKLLNDIIKTSIVFQQFTLKLPTLIQLIFGFLAQLQMVSYLEQPAYEPCKSFTIILFLTRPHIYIFTQGNYEITFGIIFLLIQIIIIVWIYYCIAFNKKKQNNIINEIQFSQMNSTKLQAIISIISLFLFINKVYLGHNIIEFCMLHLATKDQSSIIIVIISIVLILQLSIILFIQWQFLNRSIRFIPQLQYLTINQSDTNIINLYLKLLQIINYAFLQNKEAAKVAQAVLIILNFIHKFWQVRFNHIHMRNPYLLIIIMTGSIGFLMAVLQLLDSIFNCFTLRLWIPLAPINLFIIKILLDRNIQQILINKPFSEITITELKYVSCIIEQGIDTKKLENQIFLFQYVQVFCSKNEILFQYEQLLSQQIIDKIRQHMLQQILRQLENLADKIRNPFYLGQIYINYVQTLIILDKYVEAQQIIEQLFRFQSNNPSIMNSRTYRLTIRVELSNSQQTFLKILECKIIARMQNKMVQQTSKSKSNHQTISLAMKQLSIINSNTIDVQTMFLNVVISKIEFFNIILNDKTQQNQFNRKVQKILFEMETFLQKLKKNYELFPTISNQSVLMFYQVEVLNNVLDAYNFSQIVALDEDIILKHNQSELFNFFNQSFNFALFKIIDVQNIQIEYHQITQGQHFTIKEGEQLQTLIPQSLRQQHQLLVEKFLETGQNKYYQTIGETFIKIRQGIIQPIDICMDLNQKNSQNIEIITLYRLPQSEKHIIFVDSNLRLQEISHNLFFGGLNLSEAYLDHIIGISIIKIIPQFKRYIEEKTFDIKICPINFINGNEEDEQKGKTRTFNCLSDIENITLYSCHLSITQRFFQENQYIYVLRLDNLKLDKVNSITQFRCQQNSENPFDIDEQIEINLPDPEEEYQKQQMILNTERQEMQIELLQDNNDFQLIKEKKQTETSFPRFSNKINKKLENFTNLSSIAQVKRSPYYQAFKQSSIILNSQKQSKNWVAFIIIYLIYILIAIIFSIIIFDETYEFKSLISHLELLSIKNEVYQPIDSFLVTRYTIVNYNQLLGLKFIDDIEYAHLVQFPRSNLLSGYDLLKKSITKVLYIPQFQPFLEENYLILSLYVTNNTGVNYNISFRESIHLLLNYQYEYKLAYTVKPLLTDGPYFYYSYKNSLILYKKFVDLENFTLEHTLIYSNQKMTIIRLYTTVFGVISFILIILKIYHLKQIRNAKNKILSILKNQDLHQVELEIIRLKQITLKIQNSRQIIYGYSMDLDNIDKSLKKKQSNFKYRQINDKKLVSLNIFRKAFALLFHYLIYFLVSLSFYLILHNQISYYQNVAQFYQKISDASVNVLILYAWKEALYFKATFTFFTSSEIKDLYLHVEQSLDSLKQFNQDLLQLDQIDQIFGPSNQIVEKITQISVCDNLSEEYKKKASGICDKVMQGALKGGLINALSYVINSISNEYQATHFDTRQSLERLELEGSTLLSDVLSKFSGFIKEQFSLQITDLQYTVYVKLCLTVDCSINLFII
ncbi:unnamed protein product (macronuclear) [Paramecium tetraurelia]|uniref:Transmembrane protein n=1 Tax=Paramecium tetraurelia TaxID=5888 RepID=A0CM67_PARTE|nr:uncharacterized protein GSPATT00008363001 [Paramecium tetraurelia]CAK71884.1 unnamed protein product [Paramecium tetraurelia]|eukprot:XP_001439281.1 hypothetical protein (macronuclear) [Paramecium tetraurelia strain d4-2]